MSSDTDNQRLATPPESREENLDRIMALIEELDCGNPKHYLKLRAIRDFIEALLGLQKQQLLDAVEKKVIFADGKREYHAKAGDLVGTASAASMNGLRERQRTAINKLRRES